MRILVNKMKAFGILRAQLILGALVMIAVMIVLPVSIIVVDASLLLNPYLLGVVIIGMLIFGMFAYFYLYALILFIVNPPTCLLKQMASIFTFMARSKRRYRFPSLKVQAYS